LYLALEGTLPPEHLFLRKYTRDMLFFPFNCVLHHYLVYDGKYEFEFWLVLGDIALVAVVEGSFKAEDIGEVLAYIGDYSFFITN
jgi:hypothetical protein